MAVFEANTQASVSSVSKLALLIDRNWERYDASSDAIAREFLGVVKAVANEEQAIKLREARLLAWAKSRDLQEAGYSGWTAFVMAFSSWSASRTRAYVRLVESQLDVIKEAVSNSEIKLTVATRAPKALGDEASPEAQTQWIREAKLGLPERSRAEMAVLAGEDMRTVRKARELGSILIGGDAPVHVVDGYLVECHDKQLTSDQILERARATPPIPERLGKVVPEWKHDASASLLGPWIEPTDIHDCVAKLRAMEALLQYRRMVLGMAYFLIRYHYLWTSVPECDSLEELCTLHLEIGQRTLQRYAHEGLHFIQQPLLRKEIEEGRLTVDQAIFAAERGGCSEQSLQRWLELVRRLGRAELHHAREREARAKAGRFTGRIVRRDGDHLLREYDPALDMARTAESIVLRKKDAGTNGTATAAPAIGGPAARVAEHILAVGATGPIQVALRDDTNRRSQSREPEYILAPPELLVAAKYVLEVVVLPPACGTRRTVEHDRYTCQNPRCRRRTLRVHPHHIHEQQHGGTDEPSNLVTLCPACHLRGIHSAQMSVVRIEDWLVWTWPDGGVVIMHSPMSDLVYDRRSHQSGRPGQNRPSTENTGRMGRPYP